MKKIHLIITLFSINLFSQTIDQLPLLGSSWIVAQGNNKRIYPSTLPLRPEKLAIVQFKSTSSLYIAYANLTHRTYRCSAELLGDIKKQFEKNRINIQFNDPELSEIINLNYVPFNDTVWTGDKAAMDVYHKYRRVGRITNNCDTIFEPAAAQIIRNRQQYFRIKPVYYGVRGATIKDKKVYAIETKDSNGELIYIANEGYFKENNNYGNQDIDNVGYSDLDSFSKQKPFTSYRKDKTIYEYIPVEYSFKTENIGYWQVHLHPQVWYYPRDPFSGKPVIEDELKMTEKEALEKRRQSLANPDNIDLKYYRNPYLSDSASVIISFAFAHGKASEMRKMESIELADTVMNFNHYPSRMYRIHDHIPPTNWVVYHDPLYKLYSKNNEEEEYYSNIDARCPSWEVLDLQNADIIFPPRLQQPDRLVRDKDIDNGIFTYNGCPCGRIRQLRNLTPVQLRRLIFLTPPLCDRNDMVKALQVYDAMTPYMKSTADQENLKKRKRYVSGIIADRDDKVKKVQKNWVDVNGRCPVTWVDEF